MREFRSAKMGRGRRRSRMLRVGSTEARRFRSSLERSAPARDLAFGISRGEVSLGDHWDVRQARETTVRFVLGIAGKGEIEY